MTDEQDVYSAQQYREHQEDHGVRAPHSHEHGGITRDAKVSRYLSTVATHYDPMEADRPGEMPGHYEDLDETEDILGMEATETARKALENGDMADLKHLTGDQNEQADISGLKAIGKIDDVIDSPAPVVVVLGEMGAGKTDFSGLIGQRAASRADGEVKIASNIKTLKETTEWTDADGEKRDGWVPNFPLFKEWMEQDGDPVNNRQSVKIFIGDEFSVSAGGQGANGYQTATKLAKAIYLCRKYRVTLVLIAHGPKSVHPLAWRVGTIVKKLSKKKAIIAERISNNQVADVTAELEGVPPTDWRFNTADTAPWSWSRSTDTDEDDEPDEIARRVAIWTVRECKQDGLSHRETSKYVPYGKDWVGSRWREIQEGEHQAAIDSVEELTA